MARWWRHELVAESTVSKLWRLHQSPHPPHPRGKNWLLIWIWNLGMAVMSAMIKLWKLNHFLPLQCQPHIQKAAKPSVEGICAKVYHHSIEYAKRIKDKHVALLRYRTRISCHLNEKEWKGKKWSDWKRLDVGSRIRNFRMKLYRQTSPGHGGWL